ncbi:hypothetical protein PM082_008754 [Marasmius tenuissimus]|nr:hypothetical protein PM082_008754 [Marasmius tenuissimus]
MAQNINYGRDQFTSDNVQVNNFVSPMTRLRDAIVGVGASHMSQQQFDRGLECLEGTRVAIIRAILDWLASKDWSSPICWLSGAAGVGKSSIAMTVAKSRERDGLASSFFFFRPDPKRNNPSALVLSIAHDLAVRMPFAESFINRRISKDPTILEANLEDQFRELVFKPCVRWRQPRHLVSKLPLARKEPTLVIIDGLDECSDEDTQRYILSTILTSYKQSCRFPLRFLVCSRPEKWIRETFDEEEFRGLTRHFRLDDDVFPNKDIERYYLREFKKIRESAQFVRLPFPEVWPSPEDLERLVDKSSGQFVYAATIVKIVKSRGCNPLAQLSSILSYTLANPSKSFAPIDILYQMILSDHPNPEQLLPVLAAIFILPPHGHSSPEFIELLLGIPTGEVDIILRPMHSVLNIRDADIPIVPFHASFMEFLHDKSRSERFYIDAAAQHDFFAQRWIQALEPRNQPSSFNDRTKCTLWDSWTDFCLCVGRPSEELLSRLQKTDLLVVSITVAIIHQESEDLPSIITRPIQAIISWLASMPDGSLPVEIIRHFQETLEQFEYALMVESDETTQRQPRGSPYRELYALYHLILTAHPDPERLQPILTAILVLPPHLEPSPAYMGLLFGLPQAEVTLVLQGMHSVLDVCGWKDEIMFRHPSFAEYLVDQKRAHDFYIDIPTQRHVIARQWLHGVSAIKMQTYSSDQLYGKTTILFFTEWMGFCTGFTRPTRDLIDGLRDIDFASVFFCVCFLAFVERGYWTRSWPGTFRVLRDWMLKLDPRNDFAHPAQGLVNKLEESPKSFHLEQLPGTLADDDLVFAVLIAAECVAHTGLASNVTRNSRYRAPLRITECHCNIKSTGNEPDGPAKHLAYQEACIQAVRAHVTGFEVLAKTTVNEEKLSRIFQSLVESSLLQHCRLDTELLSLCKTFFGSACRGSKLRFHYTEGVRMKAKLFGWFMTFRKSFAREAAALNAQVHALPWDQWTWV